MNSDLQSELLQQRPFSSVHEEAHLSVVRTGALLRDAFGQLLKPYGVTHTQYNVLRILRGAAPHGLCRNAVGERLVTRMPDVTRLLDRMEALELITRARSVSDRRQVATRITSEGLRLVTELDDVVAAEHRRCLGHLSGQQLKSLIGLLAEARLSLINP